MDLDDLGWSDVFQRHFDAIAEPGSVPARVVRVDRTSYRLASAEGELAAVTLGRRGEAEDDERLRPAVGDWCALVPPVAGGPGVVRAVLPRRTSFSRRTAGRTSGEQVLAANIDVAFLVTGLDEDFSVRRIERLLTLTWESGADPVVILNKKDLCTDVPACTEAARSVAPGTTVLAVSAVSGEGIEELRRYARRGRTIVFLGSSGVGKSTLINVLLGQDRFATGETRARDSRGKHTTARRELVELPDGGLLIDSPGLREVGVWAGEESIAATFDDIARLAGECRFSDCTHTQEPGCAVLGAVERGELAPDRLASFHTLRREAESAAIRADEHARRQRDRKFWGKARKWLKERRKFR